VDYGILLKCVTREEESQPDLSTILAEGAGKPSWCCVEFHDKLFDLETYMLQENRVCVIKYITGQ
jgi:hypothetical protein